jgi:REP element-mobilizing transposase RayT
MPGIARIIAAYCLMPNHIHLITISNDKEGLAKAIEETHRVPLIDKEGRGDDRRRTNRQVSPSSLVLVGHQIYFKQCIKGKTSNRRSLFKI